MNNGKFLKSKVNAKVLIDFVSETLTIKVFDIWTKF